MAPVLPPIGQWRHHAGGRLGARGAWDRTSSCRWSPCWPWYQSSLWAILPTSDMALSGVPLSGGRGTAS